MHGLLSFWAPFPYLPLLGIQEFREGSISWHIHSQPISESWGGGGGGLERAQRYAKGSLTLPRWFGMAA